MLVHLKYHFSSGLTDVMLVAVHILDLVHDDFTTIGFTLFFWFSPKYAHEFGHL